MLLAIDRGFHCQYFVDQICADTFQEAAKQEEEAAARGRIRYWLE